MITATVTSPRLTVNDDGFLNQNVFRTLFIDPYQGWKMAEFAGEVLEAKTAAVLFEAGNDYAEGLGGSFIAACAQAGIEVVANESYSFGDRDFRGQLTHIKSVKPDVLFLPNFYEDNGRIVTQAREMGIKATLLGGDGWAGISDYAAAEDLEGSYFCNAYAFDATTSIEQFEADYIAAYGTETLNLFTGIAYDAAMLLVAALRKAEETGAPPASAAYKQSVIDAIRTEGPKVVGMTSPSGYTFDSLNNPLKDVFIMTISGGREVFYRMF